ncbi:MAG: DUF2945 domain-containing protein [Balneolales bacterium]
MGKAYHSGTIVEWDWGKGKAFGEVMNAFTREVQRQFNGSIVTRKASRDNPAYIIILKDGDRVLKLHSEIRRYDE